MYNDGIGNEFEQAHQKGLTRGFDLGWSYKGRFDRQIIRDEMSKIQSEQEKLKDKTKGIRYNTLQIKYDTLHELLNSVTNHPNNRENITINTW